MKQLLCCAIVCLILASCKSSDSGPSSPPPGGGGLNATPPSVRILLGQNAAVSISGGTRPESITGSPNSAVATASLSDTVVTIHGVAAGSTSVTVGDHSSPQKTVSIGITIATAAASMIFR